MFYTVKHVDYNIYIMFIWKIEASIWDLQTMYILVWLMIESCCSFFYYLTTL